MRRELLKSVKRVVIKIGSRVLTDDDGALDHGGHREDLRGHRPAAERRGSRWSWSPPGRSPQAAVNWD